MKAFLKNYRQSPRKVRLVAGLIRGKSVPQAMLILQTIPKTATIAMDRLLKSAVSNAKNQGKEAKDLMVRGLKVDAGPVMKRMMPRARGSAFRIKKRTSQISLELSEIVSGKDKKEVKVKHSHPKS